ncbi:MAG: OsmC family protein [Actinomycetota bacterium]
MRSEPDRAARSCFASTELADGLRCVVDVGGHRLVLDERPSLGGSDEGASPMEAALGVLAACQAITYRVWAAALGVRLDRVRVEAVGDLDVSGFLGLSAARPGFSAVRLVVELHGPEGRERYAELAEAVDRHCPALDLALNPVPVERRLVMNGSGGAPDGVVRG